MRRIEEYLKVEQDKAISETHLYVAVKRYSESHAVSCADDLMNFVSWLIEDVKIPTEDEYQILKRLRPSYKWIAKDTNESIWIFYQNPRKGCSSWSSVSDCTEALDKIFICEFNCLSWEDEKATEISELIKNYEKIQKV